MRIGIDLDSVLAHLIPPLNRFHNQRYGTTLKIEDYNEYGLVKVWQCGNDQVLERIFEFYASPFMDEITPMPGAIDGVSYLRKHHTLSLITSRPHIIEDKTLEWLDRYFPDTFEHIILSNQVSSQDSHKRTKSEIGNELGIKAMIDDHIDYAEDCAQNGIASYLFKAPWNEYKDVSAGITRIDGWSDIHNHF